MSGKPQTFAGHLVHLCVKDLIPPEVATKTKLPLADLKALARSRIAEQMAKFINRHFITDRVQEDGSILVETKITALVPVVPDGLAHTSIVFQEVPKA